MEADRAALALGWGKHTGIHTGNTKTGLAGAIHFSGGNRAIIPASMTFVLAPAKKWPRNHNDIIAATLRPESTSRGLDPVGQPRVAMIVNGKRHPKVAVQALLLPSSSLLSGLTRRPYPHLIDARYLVFPDGN